MPLLLLYASSPLHHPSPSLLYITLSAISYIYFTLLHLISCTACSIPHLIAVATHYSVRACNLPCKGISHYVLDTSFYNYFPHSASVCKLPLPTSCLNNLSFLLGGAHTELLSCTGILYLHPTACWLMACIHLLYHGVYHSAFDTSAILYWEVPSLTPLPLSFSRSAILPASVSLMSLHSLAPPYVFI